MLFEKNTSLQEKIKKRFHLTHKQITTGCGRFNCCNKYCASSKDFVYSKELKSKPAHKLALEIIKNSKLSTIPLCNSITPIKYTILKELFEKLQESPENISKITSYIKDSFSFGDVLEVSFCKQYIIENKIIESTESYCSLNLDEVLLSYRLIMNNSYTRKSLEISMKNILISIKFLENKSIEPQNLCQLVIYLLNPLFVDPQFTNTFTYLCHFIHFQPINIKNILVNWISKFTKNIFVKILELLHQYIAIVWLKMKYAEEIVPILTVMGVLYQANKISKVLKYNKFYNDVINEDYPKKAKNTIWIRSKNGSYNFGNHYYLFDPAVKSRLLQYDSCRQMQVEFSNAMINSLFGNRNSPYLKLIVGRDTLIQDTLFQLNAEDKKNFKKPLRIKFKGEDGVDEGGVQKEFFQLIVRQLFEPKYGMFIYDENLRHYWFNRNSFDNEGEFELIGTIIGLAIYNGVILNLHFPDVVYQKLVDYPCYTLESLKSVTPDLSLGLKKLLSFEGDVKNTYLRTFSVEYDIYGSKKTVDLKPNGRSIPLTNENREEYVNLFIDYYLNKSIEKQFNSFYRGFHNVCGGYIFDWFRWEELELLVCGSHDLDFDALEKSVIYEDGYTVNSNTVKMFWEIIHKMSIEQKKRFLFFTTGSDRVPIRGLGDLAITISKNGNDQNRLPTAHTCFNHLLLPEYKSKEILEQKLSTAIENSEGFGLL